MSKSHVWGFHCFVPADLYIVILNRFIVYFGRQDQLTKLSGQYDAVTGLATFEIIADTAIDRDLIRIVETLAYERSVTITPFSNEVGSGEAREALFLVTNIGSLPVAVAQAIRSQAILYFLTGELSSSNIAEHGNIIFISVVAVNDLPDLLVEKISTLVSGWPIFYKNHIRFPKQTK